MKKLKIAIIGISFSYLAFPWSAFSEQIQLPVFTDSSYTNSLREQSSIDSDFIDFSHLKTETYGPEMEFANATFTANQNTGIELITHTPLIAQGSKVFFQSLPASQNWQIDIKAHMSNFSSQLTEPYYYAGLTFGKLGESKESSFANRVNLNFTRSFESSDHVTSNIFRNTINSGIYNNNDNGTPPFVETADENIFLRVTYDSLTMSCTHYYSYNGINYTSFKSYFLQSVWGLSQMDRFWVALVGTSVPFQSQTESSQNQNLNYNVESGQLYLSDLKISVSNNSSTSNTTNTNPILTWKNLYFSSVANSGDSSDSFDYDKDGIPNLIEYAFGGNPKIVDSNAVSPTLARTGDNLQFSFKCNDTKTDISYIVESSSNLSQGAWTEIASSVGGQKTNPIGNLCTVSDTGSGLRTVTVSVSVSAIAKMFVRLKILHPNP